MTERKQTSLKGPMNKSQIIAHISANTALTKTSVGNVLDELAHLIERHINLSAAEQFTLPGLFKIVVVKKPATSERKGINPFTGEETIFKAKPATKTVKIKALKKLKSMVG